jgi:hypothetical protein
MVIERDDRLSINNLKSRIRNIFFTSGRGTKARTINQSLPCRARRTRTIRIKGMHTKKKGGNISKILGKITRPTTLPGKIPKGSHQIPNGKIMKDIGMKRYSEK